MKRLILSLSELDSQPDISLFSLKKVMSINLKYKGITIILVKVDISRIKAGVELIVII